MHFKDCLERVGSEHFDIKYRSGNQFRCLGNKTSERDMNGFGDLAYYMDEISV